MPTYGVDIATKAAVEDLTRVLAQEMRGARHHCERRRTWAGCYDVSTASRRC